MHVPVAAVRIGVKELEARLGVERSTVWRWYTAGRFPAPHYIGKQRKWWVHEVEAWEREQMARATPGFSLAQAAGEDAL